MQEFRSWTASLRLDPMRHVVHVYWSWRIVWWLGAISAPHLSWVSMGSVSSRKVVTTDASLSCWLSQSVGNSIQNTRALGLCTTLSGEWFPFQCPVLTRLSFLEKLIDRGKVWALFRGVSVQVISSACLSSPLGFVHLYMSGCMLLWGPWGPKWNPGILPTGWYLFKKLSSNKWAVICHGETPSEYYEGNIWWSNITAVFRIIWARCLSRWPFVLGGAKRCARHHFYHISFMSVSLL